MIEKLKIRHYILLAFSVILFVSVFAIIPKVELQEEIDARNLKENVTPVEEDESESYFYYVGISNIEDLHSEYVGELSYDRFNTNFIISIGTNLKELFYDENSFENNKEKISKFFGITTKEEYQQMRKVKDIIYSFEKNEPKNAIIVENTKKISADGIEFEVKVDYKSGISQIFVCMLYNSQKEFGAIMRIMPKVEE